MGDTSRGGWAEEVGVQSPGHPAVHGEAAFNEGWRTLPRLIFLTHSTDEETDLREFESLLRSQDAGVGGRVEPRPVGCHSLGPVLCGMQTGPESARMGLHRAPLFRGSLCGSVAWGTDGKAWPTEYLGSRAHLAHWGPRDRCH